MILRVAQGAALALVVALLGLLVWRVSHHSAGAELVKEIAAGKKPAAPRFALQPLLDTSKGATPRLRTALAGGKVTVADLGGRPTIVNFFASWCDPCKDEEPLLARAAARYAGRVQFVGLDYKDLTSDGRRFATRYGADYALLKDKGGAVGDRWGVTGMPESYVLDTRGRLVAHTAGAVDAAGLQVLVNAALASG